MQIDPSPIDAAETVQLGLEHHRAGRLSEAENAYQRVLQVDPGNFDALHFLGVIAHQVGKDDLSCQLIDAALSIRPDSAEALSNRGLALQGLGRHEDAVASYVRALDLRPDYAEAQYNLGTVLLGLRRYEEALASYDKAVSIRPDYAEAHSNRGNALQELNRPTEALVSFDKAISINPGLAKTFCSRGNLLRDHGRLTEALASYDQAISVEPAYAEAYSNRGLTLQSLARHEEALADYRKALELRPTYDVAHSNAIFVLDLMEGRDAREHQEERKRWYEMHGRKYAASIRAHDNVVEPERRLRIGYVSADFRRHAACFAFAPVIRSHDRVNFEVICYSDTVLEDDVTAGLRSASEVWRQTVGWSDEALAEQIRRDRIDILVDLTSHMAGNRLLVFARKPAPVQVTAWGYPNGTGLPTIDYLLADTVLIPPEERGLFAEEIFDLPCFLCYEPSANLPDVSPLPALSGKPFTFGCISRIEKISDGALRLWGKILAQVPDARLLIKGQALDDPELRRQFIFRLSAAGIEEARVRLIGSTSHSELLQTFHEVDVALDPFPHTGSIGTSEALWMGVPVVTMRGPTVTSRLCASILTALGMHDWIGRDADDYARIAVQASRNIEALALTRAQMRPLLAKSIFGNAQSQARTVEAAYRTMWRRWCESH